MTPKVAPSSYYAKPLTAAQSDPGSLLVAPSSDIMLHVSASIIRHSLITLGSILSLSILLLSAHHIVKVVRRCGILFFPLMQSGLLLDLML